MTEFYEIRVSRKTSLQQFVTVRVPKKDGLGVYTAERAAKDFVEAAEAAGQPVVWENGEIKLSAYGTLEAEAVGKAEEPADCKESVEPAPVAEPAS